MIIELTDATTEINYYLFVLEGLKRNEKYSDTQQKYTTSNKRREMIRRI